MHPSRFGLSRNQWLGVSLLALSLIALFKSRSLAMPHQTAYSSPPRPHQLVVGYFGQWSLYDHFLVKDLVSSGAAAQLDQINYAQGFVTNGRCSVADPHADTATLFRAEDSVNHRADDPATAFHGNLHQLAELKRLHPRLKILISLEGRAPDFAADAQPEAREAFVRSCVDIFLRGHLAGSPNVDPATPNQPGLFDGIDVDWEYPGPENASNFVVLLTEFRRQMDALRPGLRLTIAVGPSPRMYPGVDFTALSQRVDQVGIMNYDYIGPWSHTTGFLAPLSTPVGSAEGHGSVESSIAAYKQAGVSSTKLLMGLPFYGYGWKSVGPSGDGLFQTGQGIRGDRPYPFFLSLLHPDPSSANAGTTDDKTSPNPPTLKPSAIAAGSSARPLSPPAPDSTAPTSPFILHRDPTSQAPWLYNGDTFWTFEDPISIRHKTQFAVDQQLGGVMIWELSEDAPDAALVKAARFRLNHPAPDL